MAEKTEKATPKKLKDARKKGQVAKAQDMPAAMTFVVSIMGTLSMAGFIFQNLASFTLRMLREVPNTGGDFDSRAPGLFGVALNIILQTSLPIMVTVCFVGVLVSFLVTGPVFS